MIIAVEGCAHGELEKIYDTIKYLESSEQTKVDLLICCGDFQSTRNKDDLECMACPPKYRHICTFYKYYSGEKVAPILTIFIGGNHEASNYLQELPYGGWVAPNIYYMGYASIIKVAGIRIGGISGIYKGHDFLKGHFEIAPFSNDSMRSVYHIRNLEVFRLKQLTEHIDIFLSHDWPRGVYNYGNKSKLFKKKPYFREDVEMNKLGSKPCEDLLNHLKPSYWFAAHLHCKFSALIEHKTVDNTECKTKFLALDKCLPRRNFLQIITVPHDMKCPIELNYDLEWLTILYLTNHLLSTKNCFSYMPTETSYERSNFTPTEEEKDFVHKKFNYNLLIPKNFTQTAKCYDPENPTLKGFQPNGQTNPQTDLFCEKLCIDDPLRLLLMNLNSKKDLSFNETLPNYLTPERETNKTYNESLNNLSDISPIKSFSFIPRSIEINTPSSKRTSLNLPKPKLICSEPEGVLNSSSPAIKNSASKSETSESMSGEQLGACDFFIDNQPCRTNNEMHVSTYSLNKSVICESDKMSTSTPQPQKKFKKRNAAIYNSVDD